jgi:hypothetical protein
MRKDIENLENRVTAVAGAGTGQTREEQMRECTRRPGAGNCSDTDTLMPFWLW